MRRGADAREGYLLDGGREDGVNDPWRDTGVKGHAAIRTMAGMADPERLPADFMHSVARLSSALVSVMLGKFLEGKQATKGDLYDVEKAAGESRHRCERQER